jgi:DHA2 family multidrug resistance protein-like MFS transporter
MIDPGLIGSPSFTVPAVLSGVAGLGMIGLLFGMPQYFQAVRGVDAFGSGLRLLPLVGGLILGALPAGALVKAIGVKLTVAMGFVLLAAGSLIGMATRTDSTTTFVAIWMAIVCAGAGTALTAATAAALSQLSEERSGIGSAVVQAFQKTAGPFGTAIIGSVLAATYQSHLDLSGLPATAATTVRQSVYDGLAVADQLGSASLAHSVQAAFTRGVDMSAWSQPASLSRASLLTLACLPSTRARSARRPPAQPPGRAGRAGPLASRR